MVLVDRKFHYFLLTQNLQADPHYLLTPEVLEVPVVRCLHLVQLDPAVLKVLKIQLLQKILDLLSALKVQVDPMAPLVQVVQALQNFPLVQQVLLVH